jgi:cellulose biosynthesis protein BcsQ
MTPDANIDEIVLKSSVANLDFLPANRDLGTAETTLGAEIGGQQYLKRALARLKDRYDVILIDCQPTMGQLTINALVASNEVIVPLQCEYFALHGFIELKGNIEKVKNFLNPDLNLIGILATMYEKKTLHNREVLSAILEKYPDDVFETIIAKTIRFSETTVAGETITSYSSSSGGATQTTLDAWGQATSYTQSVPDPAGIDPKLNPRFAQWKASTTQELAAKAFLLPDVISLEIISRNSAGAVTYIKGTSSNGSTKLLRGDTFRSRVKIPSPYFTLVG